MKAKFLTTPLLFSLSALTAQTAGGAQSLVSSKQKKELKMKFMKYIVPIISLVAIQSHAEVISCSFTEPFFSVELNTQTKTLRLSEPDWNNPEGGTVESLLSENARVQLKQLRRESDARHVPVYTVVDGGKELMSLELNLRGTDHMSDRVFPYEAMIVYNESLQIGGCESETLPALVQEEVLP